MINIDEKKELRPSQKVSLELLDVLKQVCREQGLRYYIINDSALSLHESGGFMPWLVHFSIGMFLEDYYKFIDYCRRNIPEEKYYILSHDNCTQFDELYIRFAKRGRVKLGPGREEDEKYYDFYIVIVPIIYAGNTYREYRAIERKYIRYINVLRTRTPAPDTFFATKRKIGYIKKYIRSSYRLSRQDKPGYRYADMLNMLKRHDQPTKYIYIPNSQKCKRGAIEAEQFSCPSSYLFNGVEVYSVKNLKKYIIARFGHSYKKKLKDRYIPVPLLEGFEVMRRVQLIELEMLTEFDRICRKYNIKYTLSDGTALGAIRHKGFVPWDDDVDVVMLYEEYLKFKSVVNDELDRERFFFKTQETDTDDNLTFIQLKRNNTLYVRERRIEYDTHPGVFMDIFILFNGTDNPLKRFVTDRICKYYKTATWAHLGFLSEKKRIKRAYYRWISRKGNKYTFSKYMKYATLIKEKTPYLYHFNSNKNRINHPFCIRKNLEELTEIEFEGRDFMITKNLIPYLVYSYSSDYNRYPTMGSRAPKHLPALIDLGDLYSFDSGKSQEM